MSTCVKGLPPRSVGPVMQGDGSMKALSSAMDWLCLGGVGM